MINIVKTEYKCKDKVRQRFACNAHTLHQPWLTCIVSAIKAIHSIVPDLRSATKHRPMSGSRHPVRLLPLAGHTSTLPLLKISPSSTSIIPPSVSMPQIPHRLRVPAESVVDEHGALLSAVLLGFTRDGEHLVSYTSTPAPAADGCDGHHLQVRALGQVFIPPLIHRFGLVLFLFLDTRVGSAA